MDFDVDALIDAIQSHQWQMVIALALIALVAFADGIAEEAGLTGRPLQVTSLVRGYVGGVAASLLGGVPWWVALIVGCGGVGVSRGARQLVVDGVRWLARKAGHGAVAGLLLVALVGAGCGVTQAQVAVQSSLTGLAEGVHAGDSALLAAMPTIQERAIVCARERCGGYATCADASTYLGECFAATDAAVDGLEVAAEALHVAQAAQDAWVASDQLPDAGPLCEALGDAVTPVASLLDEAGVDVPPGVSGAGGVVQIICDVVARWATPATVEVSRDE